MRPLFTIVVLAVTAGSPERILDGRLELGSEDRPTEPSRRLHSVLALDGGVASLALLPDGGLRFHVLPQTLQWESTREGVLGDYGPYMPPYVHGADKERR
jgi:hypothetical protein